MQRRQFVTALGALALAPALVRSARADDLLKVAVPQRGAWDAGLAELGQRGGIFKKHGLTLEVLYTQAGPESIQALIAGSIDIATASGVSAALGTFAKGAPIRIIGSEIIGSPDLYWYVKAEFAGPQDRGSQRQDRRLFADRLVEPRRAAGADRAVQAHGEADLDRQHHRDAHADHDWSGGCRLFGDPVLARPGRGRERSGSSPPATMSRASRAAPVASTSPT